jgi:hypothetical protein
VTLAVTLGLLAAALATFGGALYAARRPPPPPGEPRMVPWTGIQFVSLVVVVLMLAHLVTLTTGTPFRGRAG